ncbi:MAG TPA: hypothetical protein VFP98_02650, partial [Candidatus Polarisedimenticolia bacterium]|nr:hypothetical protein [Candidatus Polarisedimenticolia bacterium]
MPIRKSSSSVIRGCRGALALAGALILLAPGPSAAPAASPQNPPADPNSPHIGVTITGTAQRQIPIAIPAIQLVGGASDPDISTAAGLIRSVVASDLEFSGLFNVLPPSLYASVAFTSGRLPLRDFAALGAQGVVIGSISRQAPGIAVEGLIYDPPSEALIAGKRYRGEPSLARDIAHRISNDVLIAYTGRPGVALSRIVTVGRVGKGKEIFVMDYDGHDIKQITKNQSLNVSPAWSPDGKRLAFVSYRHGNPRLYIYNGGDGSLVDRSPPGSELCVAPEWSPDGRLIAFSSSSGGDSEIFLLDVATGRSRQITFHRGSDTAPTWSPSGRELAFTSDRSGRPHLYVMDAEGANVRPVTSEGNYNDSAAWSPDGRRLAYASRIDGRFDILVMDL